MWAYSVKTEDTGDFDITYCTVVWFPKHVEEFNILKKVKV